MRGGGGVAAAYPKVAQPLTKLELPEVGVDPLQLRPQPPHHGVGFFRRLPVLQGLAPGQIRLSPAELLRGIIHGPAL